MTNVNDIKSHKIMTMDAEKREHVISAAMSEFCKGFKNASTDDIVAEAGISKGLLFHYFGTKKGLYEFLLHYAFDILRENYFDLISADRKDLLEHLEQMIRLKFDLSYKHPALFEFITAAYTRANDYPGNEFAVRIAEIQAEIAPRISSDRNTSLFKDGIDAEKAVNIIMWTLEGYSESKLSPDKKLKDYQSEYEKYLIDLKEYFSIFRKLFFK
ncbi:MAG: TetR/AcrR family transcriptional regulator [Oscillospiraceae bacterium]|nr:TetR/AcrR family transcriptional regulator [Oscillospiraceae bacterium]